MASVANCMWRGGGPCSGGPRDAMSYRDEGELTGVVREIHRRRFVRWRDWGLFLLAVGLSVAVAIY